MAISHKYRTFDQLLEDVKVDFSTYDLEGMIEPQQLIKVATRVNYDLGLRIHQSKESIIDVEHNKAQMPSDFKTLNYAFVCSEYQIVNTAPSGTHTDTTQPKWTPDPSQPHVCTKPEDCENVCVVKTCPVDRGKGVTTFSGEYIVLQRMNESTVREYTSFFPLRITSTSHVSCECPNLNTQSHNLAEIQDGYLLTTFTTGKVYLSYQGILENNDGELLVLDHPYCNEYYEYALKERILENMIFQGENVAQQLGLIQVKLRAARNNALGFVNTPNFEEVRKIWEVNRKAQYHNYYDMFASHAPRRRV
tara:strand:- start:7798 stop:8715 length:918 start_codon:yes stop_codon:yes gene_type:complete